MSEWKSVLLHEVATIERNAVGASEIKNATTYVGLENIESGGELIGVREVDEGELASNKFTFTDRHVLYGKLRPYLAKIARPSFSGICSTDILPLLPGEKLDRSYLAHFLLQPAMVDFANSRATGANLPRLSPRSLAEFSIPLPALPEQRRIAEILDRAEALRAKRRAALVQLDSLTQSIFLHIFGDPRLNPHDWKLYQLKELGRVKTGGTPPSAKSGMFDGPIPFVTPGDLESESTVKRTLTKDGADEVVTVREGSTFVCCIGATIGKMGRASVRSAFNQQINAVEWSGLVNDDFGLATLSFFKSQIAKRGSSTTLPILKKSLFEQIEIPVPPIELQQTFADRVSKLACLKMRHREAIGQLGALFASLQNRAFRGEL